MFTGFMTEARAPALAGSLLPRPFRIERVRRETKDTFTLTLAPGEGGKRVDFAAGQFNMLYVFGVGEVPISISGDPARPEALQHTIRAVGAVTCALGRLRRGDVVGLRGPFGSGWGVEQAAGADLVLVAGGIGLAPLRPVIYRLLAERTRFGRVILLYGARTPADVLFAKELPRWRARFDLEVEVTVDVAGGDWRGNVGLVTSLIPRAPFDATSAMALICGPEVMMRFVVQDLLARGLSPERIRLSLERNMKCAIGHCGHCQFGPEFICKDGPVLAYSRIAPWFGKPEI
jgi:NAD(P)H-flavin reductase